MTDDETALIDQLWTLWDFSQPAESEQRFRAALADRADSPTGEAALLARTQLARTLGLQGRFEECAAELDAVAAHGEDITALVRAYERLERGRMHRSAGDPAAAVPLFLASLAEAERAGLDHVAADAAHMMAIVGERDEQIAWAERGLAIAHASTEPRGRRWIGTLENNLGWTLHDTGRLEEALEHWETALRARMDEGDAERTRIARWTVARGLRSLGRVEEALAIQWDLAQNGPEDGYVHEELAELLRAQGDSEAAERHAARAKELLA